MELGEVSEVVRSYPWRCIECKICEICQEKGDDVSPPGCIPMLSISLTHNERTAYYSAISVIEVRMF